MKLFSGIKITITIIILMYLLFSNLMSSSNTDKYPEFSWDTMPLYMHVWKQTAYTEDEIEYLASYPLITLEKVQGRREGTVQEGTLKAARAIKKINAKAKILYYKNIVIDWGNAASKELPNIVDGYLQTKDGDYPVVNDRSKARFFDIAKPEIHKWWIKDARDMLSDPSIDGLFIDANIKVLIETYFANSKKLGKDKAQDLIQGYHALLAKINDEFRDNNIILANILRARFEQAGLEYITYFDGSYFESFEHNVAGISKADYLVKGIEAGQTAARDGKILAFTAGLGETIDNDSSGIGLDEARKKIDSFEHVKKRLDYLTAIFLIMAEEYSYFYPHDGYGVQFDKLGKQVNRVWMHTFPLFKQRLGAPLGPAKRDGYVFTRQFKYCSVYLDVEAEEAILIWK